MKPINNNDLTGATLVSVPDPFGPATKYVAPQGLTFAEMAAHVDDLPPFFWDGGGAIYVAVTDRRGFLVREYRVPRDIWHIAKPKCGPAEKLTVAFGVNLQGGGSGGKNVVAIVALVAVLAVAAAVSGGALAGTFGSAFASGTVGAKIAAAAVTVAGTMAIAALTKQPAIPNLGTPENKQANTALVQVNPLAPGAPLPRVLGTKRIRPPAICEPLTEYSNDNVITEVVLGLAGPHLARKGDVLFGGHSASSIDNGRIAIEIRRGLTTDALQRTVKRYGHTDQTNQPLTNHKNSGEFFEDGTEHRYMKLARSTAAAVDLVPQWHTVTLRSASTTVGGPVNEHWVNLTVPSLFASGENLGGAVDPGEPIVIPFRAQMRLVRSDGTFGQWINWPEFHFVRNYHGQFTFPIKIYWEKLRTRPAIPPSRDDSRGGMWAYTKVEGQTLTPKTEKWVAHRYFINPRYRRPGSECYSYETYKGSNLLNMVGRRDRWDVYLDPNTFPQGTYELRIKRGAPTRISSWDELTRNEINPLAGTTRILLRPDPFYFFAWPLPLRTIQTPGTPSVLLEDGIVSDVAITSVSAVINKQPSPGRDVCCIAIRATNVGNIGDISVKASGLVKDWDGTGWNTLRATSNPAPHVRDMYAGTLNALSVPSSLIDDDDFVAFRSRCNQKNYQVNAEITGMSLPEAVDLTLGCGFGGARNAEQFGCTYERDRSAEGVTQTFTPRNMANFRVSKPFPQLSGGIRAIYPDKNNDYQDNIVTVLYPNSTAPVEETRYEGLVTQGEVIRRAKFDLWHSRLRLAEYSWTAPLEFIRCRKGDLVGVQTDVILLRSGWGRIMSKTVNGSSQITSFVLDQTIPSFPSISGQITLPDATFGVSITRKNGDVTVHKATVAADKKTVTLNTPIDNTTDIAEGTLITAGNVGVEFERLIIKEIIPKDSTSAEIIAFEEAQRLIDILEAATADVQDAAVGAPIPRMLDFRYPQNSGYLPLAA